jgi:hypothetical protein
MRTGRLSLQCKDVADLLTFGDFEKGCDDCVDYKMYRHIRDNLLEYTRFKVAFKYFTIVRSYGIYSEGGVFTRVCTAWLVCTQGPRSVLVKMMV